MIVGTAQRMNTGMVSSSSTNKERRREGWRSGNFVVRLKVWPRGNVHSRIQECGSGPMSVVGQRTKLLVRQGTAARVRGNGIAQFPSCRAQHSRARSAPSQPPSRFSRSLVWAASSRRRSASRRFSSFSNSCAALRASASPIFGAARFFRFGGSLRSSMANLFAIRTRRQLRVLGETPAQARRALENHARFRDGRGDHLGIVRLLGDALVEEIVSGAPAPPSSMGRVREIVEAQGSLKRLQLSRHGRRAAAFGITAPITGAPPKLPARTPSIGTAAAPLAPTYAARPESSPREFACHAIPHWRRRTSLPEHAQRYPDRPEDRRLPSLRRLPSCPCESSSSCATATTPGPPGSYVASEATMQTGALAWPPASSPPSPSTASCLGSASAFPSGRRSPCAASWPLSSAPWPLPRLRRRSGAAPP